MNIKHISYDGNYGIGYNKIGRDKKPNRKYVKTNRLDGSHKQVRTHNTDSDEIKLCMNCTKSDCVDDCKLLNDLRKAKRIGKAN